MILRLLLFILVCTSVSASATSAGEKFTFKGDEAVVYSDDGVALFRAKPDFILAYANNADVTIFGWNREMRLVRINPLGKPGFWLSCNELMPIAGKCDAGSAAGNQSIRNGNIRGNGRQTNRPSGAVPMCPGDLRCPAF